MRWRSGPVEERGVEGLERGVEGLERGGDGGDGVVCKRGEGGQGGQRRSWKGVGCGEMVRRCEEM